MVLLNEQSKSNQIKMNQQLEYSLKGEIKRQVSHKKRAESDVEKCQSYLLQSWRLIPDVDARNRLIWAYGKSINACVRINSSHVGIKTNIGVYKAKKTSKETQAHFTQFGSYLGSVAKLGATPVYYDGYFNIDESYTKINEECIKSSSSIKTLFVSKF